MARTVFHLRSVCIYFAILIAVHVSVQIARGSSLSEVLLGSTWMLGLGLTAIAILAVLAWSYARTTIYTLTNKRLVLRFGVAMPMMVNIPLSILGAADMRQHKDGSGDIILTLNQKKRLSYFMLWPNVRPMKFSPIQPAMRSLGDVGAAASALASVIAETNPSTTEESREDSVASQRDRTTPSMLGTA
jgi:hypothetical protein